LNATISGSPPFVTFSDDTAIPSRHDLEMVLSSVSAINNRLKAFDKEVSLSKAYLAKQQVKAAQGRLSPLDGEPEARWNARESDQGRRQGSRYIGRSSLDLTAFDDKMEE
jgi:hypothetical protein